MERGQRQELEEDGAERVDVGARVELGDLPEGLLRRHVAEGPEDAPRAGVDLVRARIAHREGGVGVRELLQLGQAPVEHVDLAEVAEHDVGGLEIAVEHAARVGEIHRQADGGEGGEEAAARELARHLGALLAQAAEDLAERHPAEALHGEIHGAGLVDAEVVDGDDRRVLELALHAGLAEEARAELRVEAVLGEQHLQRHLAPDPRVAAAEDFAHRSAAEQAVRSVAIHRAVERAHAGHDEPGAMLPRGAAGSLGRVVRGLGSFPVLERRAMVSPGGPKG